MNRAKAEYANLQYSTRRKLHSRATNLLEYVLGRLGYYQSPRTLDGKGFWRYIPLEEWEVEFTDEFGTWWGGLTEAAQVDIRAEVNLLRRFGSMLGRPHVDSVASSKHANMKELRV